MPWSRPKSVAFEISAQQLVVLDSVFARFLFSPLDQGLPLEQQRVMAKTGPLADLLPYYDRFTASITKFFGEAATGELLPLFELARVAPCFPIVVDARAIAAVLTPLYTLYLDERASADPITVAFRPVIETTIIMFLHARSQCGG